MMKQVRKWSSRVSLTLFCLGMAYVVTHIKDFPEVAHIDSTGSAVINLLVKVLQ